MCRVTTNVSSATWIWRSSVPFLRRDGTTRRGGLFRASTQEVGGHLLGWRGRGRGMCFFGTQKSFFGKQNAFFWDTRAAKAAQAAAKAAAKRDPKGREGPNPEKVVARRVWAGAPNLEKVGGPKGGGPKEWGGPKRWEGPKGGGTPHPIAQSPTTGNIDQRERRVRLRRSWKCEQHITFFAQVAANATHKICPGGNG